MGFHMYGRLSTLDQLAVISGYTANVNVAAPSDCYSLLKFFIFVVLQVHTFVIFNTYFN
jgi:hypothetical protein